MRKMWKIYPSKEVELGEVGYYVNKDDAEAEMTRMMAWTGVEWLIESVEYDENKISY